MARAPAADAPRVPTNLEPAPTRFIGRDVELDALADLVADAKVVSVLGPPGVGKTRLAREYAERAASALAPRFPGGVWFVELGEVRSLTGVQAAVRAALDIESATGELEAKHDISRAVARLGKTLLVLDDADAVVAELGPVLACWAAGAGEARFIVTCRERLRIGAEAIFDLGPLTLPSSPRSSSASDAVALFHDRAQALDRNLVWNDEQRRAVRELCVELDGLPLAIELAAARTRVLAPSQIRDSLKDHGELIKSSHTSGMRAQKALLSAIESSWANLGPREQQALAVASVFAGGFEWQAAEAVFEGLVQGGVLDALQALRDRSLLGVETSSSGERRFTMLVSVRLFAAEQLTPALRSRAHHAHAEYFTRGLEAHASTGAGRRRLVAERDNLLAVLERAIADGRAWHALTAAVRLASLASSLSYGWSLSLVDRALETAPAGEREAELEAAIGWALEARGTTLRFLGRTRESMEALDEARERAERSDEGLLARALTGLGNGSTVLARWADARGYFERALAIYERRPDRLTEGRVRTMLAASYYSEDQLEPAADHLDRALAIQREQHDRSFEGMSVTSMGVIDIARGRASAARASLDEALAIHRETNDRHWEAVTIGYLGTLALDATGEGADLEGAALLLSQARAILNELGVRRAEAIVVGQLGHAAVLRGAYDEALAEYRACLTWHRQTSPDYEGVVLAAIAAIAALRGDVAAAKPGFERALRVLAPFSRPSFQSAVALYTALYDVALAQKALAAGDLAAADIGEARARAVLESTLSTGELRSTESRFAARLLASALVTLENERKSSLAAKDPRSLVVEPTGLWFRAPGSETVVRLHRRRALSTMLRALVERRAARPGDALPVPSLLESGWPGERVLPEAGQERVYTAIATLRRMGLRDVLIRRDDGYLLSPDVVVVRSSAEETT